AGTQAGCQNTQRPSGRPRGQPVAGPWSPIGIHFDSVLVPDKMCFRTAEVKGHKPMDNEQASGSPQLIVPPERSAAAHTTATPYDRDTELPHRDRRSSWRPRHRGSPKVYADPLDCRLVEGGCPPGAALPTIAVSASGGRFLCCQGAARKGKPGTMAHP